MHIQEAKKIMGINVIGPEELARISAQFQLPKLLETPEVPFDSHVLEKNKHTHILVLGVARDAAGHPLTINRLRDMFGVDPAKNEPCMYNQDWYTKETFASETTLIDKWYLVAKNVLERTRAVVPLEIEKGFESGEKFPSAILTAFTFFTHYFLTGEILWKHDFVWCEDVDANNDRIYTGRYVDPKGINKNGFNIHRHLSLKQNYASAPEIVL